MDARVFLDASIRWICDVCTIVPATHFCNCQEPPVQFCLNCFSSHNAKHPGISHQAISSSALGKKLEDYMNKSKALAQGAAELRRNIDKLDQFGREFVKLVQACISYLTEYQSWHMQQLQIEKDEFITAVDRAVRETSNCLDQGMEPESGLALALWTLSHTTSYQLLSDSSRPTDLSSYLGLPSEQHEKP